MKTACGPVPVTRQSETPCARWNSAGEIQFDPLVDSLIGCSFESCQSPKPVTSADNPADSTVPGGLGVGMGVRSFGTRVPAVENSTASRSPRERAASSWSNASQVSW